MGFSSSLNIIDVKRAIQVDVVEMPKMSLQELKNLPSINEPDQVEEKVQEIKKDEPFVVKKVNLMDRLKNLAKKEVKEKKTTKKIVEKKEPSKEELAHMK